MKRDSGDRNIWIMVAEYTALAFLLPAAIFVGYLIGTLLDRAFGTNFLYIVFILFGIAAGLIEIVRKASKAGGAQDGG